MKKGSEVWVEEGFKLFAEKGMEGLNVAALSRSVGIAKSSFYYFFESLEAYFEELVDYWIYEVTVNHFEEASQEETPRDKYIKLAKLNFDTSYCTNFYAQMIVLAADDVYAYRRMHQARKKRENFILALFIEEGFDEALLRKKSEMLFSLSFGWTFRNRDKFLDNKEDGLEQLGEVWDAMVSMLESQPDKNEGE